MAVERTNRKKLSWTKVNGASLRKMRRNFSLTQAQVAEEVGCTASRIAELERATASGDRRTGPSEALGKRIALFFSEKAASISKKSKDK